MVQEVIHYLACMPGKIIIDGTLGGGGHAEKIAETLGTSGKVIGIDRDEEAISFTKKRLSHFGDRVIIVKGNFANIALIASDLGFTRVDGILLDLGLSSHQVDTPNRGFSFRFHNGPLNMRTGNDARISAEDVVNTYSLQDLSDIFYKYGEEPKAKVLATAILNYRKTQRIKTVGNLLEAVNDCFPKSHYKKRIHPVTKIFQAIRIEVNDEINNVSSVLNSGLSLLNAKGRFVIISYHSLEDRIVKQMFKQKKETNHERDTTHKGITFKLLTKKPVRPSYLEIQSNPRIRSAKLRAVEKET